MKHIKLFEGLNELDKNDMYTINDILNIARDAQLEVISFMTNRIQKMWPEKDVYLDNSVLQVTIIDRMLEEDNNRERLISITRDILNRLSNEGYEIVRLKGYYMIEYELFDPDGNLIEMDWHTENVLLPIPSLDNDDQKVVVDKHGEDFLMSGIFDRFDDDEESIKFDSFEIVDTRVRYYRFDAGLS